MKYFTILALSLLLVGCGEKKLSLEEHEKCCNAVVTENINPNQDYYVDEYGYLCFLVSPTDLTESPNMTAEYVCYLCCKPPLRGVKIFNLDGIIIGKFDR